MKENINQTNILTDDSVNIKINFDKTKGPVFNIDTFIAELSINHIELISEENIDEIKDESISISSVSMKGPADYVSGSIISRFDNLKQYLTEYIEGEESIINKEWELLYAKYNIKIAIFQLNLASQNIHNLSLSYRVILSNGEVLDGIPAFKIKFSDNADNEIRKHLSIRIELFTIMTELIELYLFQLNNIKFEKKYLPREKNSDKEKLLLEIWLGLKEAGYLDFLGTDGLIMANQRKAFYEIFNLEDVDFNDKHKNFKKKVKDKGGRLRSLADNLEKAYIEKSKDPNNPT